MSYAALNADQRGGTSPNGKPSLTIGQAAARLTREGLSWSAHLGEAAVVTYAYRASAPAQMPDDTSGFGRFAYQQITYTELALSLWAKVANIKFVRVGSGTYGDAAYADNATILFGNYSGGQAGAAGFAFLPGNTAPGSAAGDVWLNSTIRYNSYPTASNDVGFLTLLHEIGHAIGLAHPSDYEASGQSNISYAANAGYFEDSKEYSLMSYFDLGDTGGAITRYDFEPGTPMIDDIAAAQRLYGANVSGNDGNTVYGGNPYSDFLATGRGDSTLLVGGDRPLWGTIWDGGGIDTLDFAGSSTPVKIDLRAGAFSDVQGGIGTLSIAAGVMIENAVGGAYDDVLIGNAASNLLIGGAGSDRAVIATATTGANFAVAGNGDIVVSSSEGVDTLRGIETIRFTDRDVTTGGMAGTDALYRTYGGRPAQSGEILYWIGQLGTGRTLGDVRAAILADGLGHANTVATVQSLYQTLLGRAAGASEVSFWEGQVRAGTDFMGVRSGLIADPAAQARIAAQVGGFYQDYMSRAASSGEITYWTGQYAAGTDYPAIRIRIASDFSA